ncbi:hypothetical protein Tco_0585689 [Tanacetum coccineum]
MKRGFQGTHRPLLPSMLLVATNPTAGQEHAAQASSQPSSSSPTPTPPPIPTPTPPIPTPTPPIPTPTPTPPPIPTPTPPIPTLTPPIPTPTPTPPPTSPPPPPPLETEPTTDEYLYEEHSPVHHHFSPSQEQASMEGKSGGLKKMEGFLKRRKLVLSDSKEEEPEAQGRKREEPEEVHKSHTTLDAVPKTSLQGCLFKVKSIDKEGDTREEKRAKGMKDTGNEQVSTVGAKKSTSDQDKGQREGKAPMISEETPKKSKGNKCLQRKLALLKAIRLDTLQKEEVAKIVVKEMRGSELQEKDFASKWLICVDKDDLKIQDELVSKEEFVTGTKTPINPVPVAMKTPSIATYKYGMSGPEDELERVFWNYLENMFEEPLSTDPIWSGLGQQKIISWRYYESCRVHCLNLESMDVYMLIERTYPLSAEMCKAMLDKKLQGG